MNKKQWQKLHQLWNSEYPSVLNYVDFQTFEANISTWGSVNHRLINRGEEVVGWLADFDRDDQRWFALIVSRRFQRSGIGRRLIELAKQNNDELNGWVIDEPGHSKADGSAYISPLPFYLRLGFHIEKISFLDKYAIQATKINWTR
jgi:GNAT superfamily N-acetyltransferase